jgi:hypothetical protein
MTVPADASQHQIVWNPDMNEEDLGKNAPPLTRLAKKKSSTFSIHDIKKPPQALDEVGLKKRTSNGMSQINLTNLNNLYNLGDGMNPDDFDINLDGLYLNSSNPKITKSIPRRPNVGAGFGKSLSGLSNMSNSNDFGNGKNSQMQADNNNLFKTLQNSLNFQNSMGFVKVPINVEPFDINEKEYDNLAEIPNISSRGNSFQQLLKNDPTPSLFRGSSSIIDPRMIKKKL